MTYAGLSAPTTTHSSLSSARILVVDSDTAIRRLVRKTLTKQGYRVEELGDKGDVLPTLLHYRPDILIIGASMNELAYLELIAEIHVRWPLLPVLVISECCSESFTVAMLDSGADDMLSKPFGTSELSARVRAALRHIAQSKVVFTAGDLTVDLARRIVTLKKQAVHLTPVEYDLLKNLIAHAGAALTPNQLAVQLWGSDTPDMLHRLRTHMSNLRTKLEADKSVSGCILTEVGVGYRIAASD